MIHHGDCLDILKSLPNDSVHSLVTDPPAGISFMNKSWDDDKGGRDEWIKWLSEVMQECMRVMKPGAHGLVWALPRTSHWTATALENAGFEIRDIINHLFGSGFPKSLNISKAIDKMNGDERIIIGQDFLANQNGGRRNSEHTSKFGTPRSVVYNYTVSNSNDGKQWEGWGTALKPACEHWILIRKPLAEKNIALNVIKHSCGGINIDESRIYPVKNDDYGRSCANSRGTVNSHNGFEGKAFKISERSGYYAHSQGRFPSNLILSHSEGCVFKGEKKVKGSNPVKPGGGVADKKYSPETMFVGLGERECFDYTNNDGTETVADYECTENCAVRQLDEQSGVLKSGSRLGESSANNDRIFKLHGNKCEASEGGASRFFYCAKVSPSERNEGVNKNHHPTVKSIKLMTYLIKLITPAEGTVLDPFMGSGSTGIAAIKSNFNFIGIEKELEYFEIAKARIEHAEKNIELKQLDFEETGS